MNNIFYATLPIFSDLTTRSPNPLSSFKHGFPGSYIFIEASSPRVAGDKATLNAGPFKPGQNFCFTFYYHMFGLHIGRLSVYRSGMNKTNLQVLWTRNTSLSIYWNVASLDIKSTEAFYVSVHSKNVVFLKVVVNSVQNKF